MHCEIFKVKLWYINERCNQCKFSVVCAYVLEDNPCVMMQLMAVNMCSTVLFIFAFQRIKIGDAG